MKTYHYHYHVETFYENTPHGEASGVVSCLHKPTKIEIIESLIKEDITRMCRAAGDSQIEAEAFCKHITKMHVVSFSRL